MESGSSERGEASTRMYVLSTEMASLKELLFSSSWIESREIMGWKDRSNPTSEKRRIKGLRRVHVPKQMTTHCLLPF